MGVFMSKERAEQRTQPVPQSPESPELQMTRQAPQASESACPAPLALCSKLQEAEDAPWETSQAPQACQDATSSPPNLHPKLQEAQDLPWETSQTCQDASPSPPTLHPKLQEAQGAPWDTSQAPQACQDASSSPPTLHLKLQEAQGAPWDTSQACQDASPPPPTLHPKLQDGQGSPWVTSQVPQACQDARPSPPTLHLELQEAQGFPWETSQAPQESYYSCPTAVATGPKLPVVHQVPQAHHYNHPNHQVAHATSQEILQAVQASYYEPLAVCPMPPAFYSEYPVHLTVQHRLQKARQAAQAYPLYSDGSMPLVADTKLQDAHAAVQRTYQQPQTYYHQEPQIPNSSQVPPAALHPWAHLISATGFDANLGNPLATNSFRPFPRDPWFSNPWCGDYSAPGYSYWMPTFEWQPSGFMNSYFWLWEALHENPTLPSSTEPLPYKTQRSAPQNTEDWQKPGNLPRQPPVGTRPKPRPKKTYPMEKGKAPSPETISKFSIWAPRFPSSPELCPMPPSPPEDLQEGLKCSYSSRSGRPRTKARRRLFDEPLDYTASQT